MISQFTPLGDLVLLANYLNSSFEGYTHESIALIISIQVNEKLQAAVHCIYRVCIDDIGSSFPP